MDSIPLMFVSFSILLLILAIILQKFFPSYKKKKPDPFFEQQYWTIWHAALLLLISAYSAFFLANFLIKGWENSLNPFWTRFLIPILNFAILFVFFRPFQNFMKPLGLSFDNLKANFVVGLKGFLWLVALANVLFAVSSEVGNKLIGINEKWGETLESQGAILAYAAIFINCIFLFLYALQEEIVFRGLLYGTMRQHLPPYPAMILNSLFFSGFHGEFSILVFILGMVFSYMYEKYRTLWPIVFFHSMWNGFLMFYHNVGIPVDLSPVYYHLLIALFSLAVLLFLKLTYPSMGNRKIKIFPQ